MLNLFYAGLTFAFHLLSPRHDTRLQFLMLQIRILKSRLRSDRVVPTPEEKAELPRLGGELNHDISDIIAIVKPETYRKWRTQSKDGKVAKRSGPAGLATEVKELICRLAKENVLWGYPRIVGELKKLGHTVAPSSVKRVMTSTPRQARAGQPRRCPGPSLSTRTWKRWSPAIFVRHEVGA